MRGSAPRSGLSRSLHSSAGHKPAAGKGKHQHNGLCPSLNMFFASADAIRFASTAASRSVLCLCSFALHVPEFLARVM